MARQSQSTFSPLTPAPSPLRGEGVAKGALSDSRGCLRVLASSRTRLAHVVRRGRRGMAVRAAKRIRILNGAPQVSLSPQRGEGWGEG